MWIDYDQLISIDHAMLKNDSDRNGLVTAERPREYWAEAQRNFLLRYNSRFGETKQSYNPYMWQREIIFNTEQDAIKFCLKVL